ncbi:MFS transporter [Alkalihalobacillus hemicellulosilyticus]|uniref:Nitrate/nitrite transporter n=1 Tax=Halalkalibacter hemicellulosilyticusJCM 9152 TaxID=1236971 RepID=W4QA39_9BACI|nr:MFS transporter [Halalkalibacter hemicellulosilyticus]GAE28875.1 nitrate/nitrite transporter [Halalkalibacter hemicellulosilyticusJCM 9152]
MNFNKKQASALIFATVAMIVSFTVWSVFSPIANMVQEQYGLSETEKSFLIVTPIILGSVMRIPIGIVADRLGARKVYAVIMAFAVIPLIAAGFAQSYAALLFWAFLIGMTGTTFTIAITYVTKFFPKEQQGLALGIIGIGNLGTAMAALFIPSVVYLVGMSWMFWILAAVLSLMTIIFWFMTEDADSNQKSQSLMQSLSVLQFKDTWILSAYYFLTFGGFVAFGFYLPTLFQDMYQLSPVVAGWFVAGFVIIATLIRPLGGYLADRFGANQVLTFLFVGIITMAIILAFSLMNLVLFSVACGIMALLLGSGNGAVFKLVPGVSPKHTGAVTGVVSAVGGVGGFFPPIVMGFFLEMTGSYATGFWLMSLFAIGCLLVHIYPIAIKKQVLRRA